MPKTSKTLPPKRLEPQGKAFSNFSPKSVLNLFLERWWIGLIAGAAGATAFVLAQPKQDPIYRAEVKLLFEPKKEQVVNINPVVDTTTQSTTELNMHIAQINSETFYEYVQSSFVPKEIDQIQNAYRDPENPNAPLPSLRAIVKNNLTIDTVKGTPIVAIGVYNRDPEAAAMIANRYARKYIDFTLDRASTGTNSAIVFLKNQSEDKRREVEEAEREMQAYRAKNNMAALGENKNVILQKLNSLGSALVQTQLDQTNGRTVLQAIDEYTKQGRDLMEISQIASYGSVASLKGQIEGLKSDRNMLAPRYGEEHWRMKENALAIENAEKRLKDTIAMAVHEIQSRYQLAVEHEQRLQKELEQSQKDARELDRISIDYKFLEDDANAKRAALNQINARLNEALIVSQLDSVQIKILDRAGVPSFPVNATPGQVAVKAGVCGVFLLIFVPLGLGLLDTRVKAPADVEDGLDQILLGGIKTMKKLSETERPNVFRLGKDDSLSEAYRGVFSEIEIRSVVPFPKRLLVTSSVPSEGKSLTASNLAAVFAAHGKKTLLVDCDFRRPTLRRYFGAQAGVGLLPWLRENGHRPDAQIDAQKLGIMNVGPCFDLLPAGDAIKNPTEIIDQIANCDLFNKLSTRYDLIVIDTPPSAVFPDALLLSRFCAEMVYVCRFKTVRKALIRKTLSKFSESGIGILGIILNCVPNSSIRNYGYDGYGAYNSDYYKSYQTEKKD